MNPTRRYFLACDRLDMARASGHEARIRRMKAINEKLEKEARAALNEKPSQVEDLFATLGRICKPA